MGLILLFIAIVLFLLVSPLGLLTSFGYNALKYNRHYALSKINYDLRMIALSVDMTGNVVCKDLFNLLFITESGYSFGKRKETISSVLGKNQLLGTLRKPGRIMVELLNRIDSNHCLNSIDKYV